MKRLLLLLLVAAATFLLIALYKNPELLNDIWLWIVGLAGTIIQLVRDLFNYVERAFDKSDDETKKEDSSAAQVVPVAATASQPNNSIPLATSETVTQPSMTADLELRLLRYMDDGQTTVGLLYIGEQFYCYTLEDTFHEVKVPKETRIPAGTYRVQFNPVVTPLTQKYRT